MTQQESTKPDRNPAHPLLARLYDPVMAIPERTVFANHRTYLAAELSGSVLDVGSGTGAMFPHFEAVENDLTVSAIEPDPYMRRHARERAAAVDIDVTVVDARAETLPFPENRFDAATAALVFCTIPDTEAALDEIARVLRPGGEFRFVEHVRGRGGVGFVHDALAPGWYHVAGGCNLNRQTSELFRQDGRFELLDFTRFESGVSQLLPLVRGRMERRRESWF